MRTVFGQTLYRIHTWSAASVALLSVPEYEAHKIQYLPRRHDDRPGEKFLAWTHCEGNPSLLVPINRATAKAAGTTVRSLMKAYPSDWYTVGDDGKVWVTFPDGIRYGDDLPEYKYFAA